VPMRYNKTSMILIILGSGLVVVFVIIPTFGPLVDRYVVGDRLSPEFYESARRHNVGLLLVDINGHGEFIDEVDRLIAEGYTPNEAVTQVTQTYDLMKIGASERDLPYLGQSAHGRAIMIDMYGAPYEIQNLDGILVLYCTGPTELGLPFVKAK